MRRAGRIRRVGRRMCAFLESSRPRLPHRVQGLRASRGRCSCFSVRPEGNRGLARRSSRLRGPSVCPSAREALRKPPGLRGEEAAFRPVRPSVSPSGSAPSQARPVCFVVFFCACALGGRSLVAMATRSLLSPPPSPPARAPQKMAKIKFEFSKSAGSGLFPLPDGFPRGLGVLST